MPHSTSSLALALVLVVALRGVLPSVSSSRGPIGVTSDGLPDDHLLMMERFHGWMTQHGRSYPTIEEKLRRFSIYRSNVEFIEAANRDGRLTYTLGENKFTDLTHEEFLSMYTSRGASPSETETETETVITTRAGDIGTFGSCSPASKDVPTRFNWVDQGKVTEVKDQGKCGSCWAFTAVATIESAYGILMKQTPPVLSEQELIDCDNLDDGCKSGKAYTAYNWVSRNGIVLQSRYPQDPWETEKAGRCKKENTLPRAANVSDYKFVQQQCEQQLMAAVYKQPVAVEFDATDTCFQHYKEGVYNGVCIEDGVYVHACPRGPRDHSLAIVGYDDEEKYWIAKNSWGNTWGNKGYVLLKKDVDSTQGLCGIAIKPVYPVVRK